MFSDITLDRLGVSNEYMVEVQPHCIPIVTTVVYAFDAAKHRTTLVVAIECPTLEAEPAVHLIWWSKFYVSRGGCSGDKLSHSFHLYCSSPRPL